MELRVAIEDAEPHEVTLTRTEAGGIVWIDGRRHLVGLHDHGDRSEIVVDERAEPIWMVADGDHVFVQAFGRSWKVEVTDPHAASAAGAGVDPSDAASAPMPGTVIDVAVAAGQQVEEGEPLLIVESMKMRSEIVAWRDGVVERVHHDEGEAFSQGAVLVSFQSEDGDGGEG